MIEERNKRALQRKLEENQEIVAIEKKKTECLAHFERCFRELGFDAQARNLAQQALKHRGIFLQEVMLIQKQGVPDDEDEATKRKLEKAMRRIARTDGVLKKNSFENWVAWYGTIKNFMQKVGWRSNLKRIFFDKWTEWFSEFQGSKAMCDRLHGKKSAHLVQEVWHAWRELHEEEAEKKGEEVVNTTDPAHLASLLRKLEAAVVETHQKHSCLLEMTHNEEIMGTLLQKLSPAACDTLRDAGITKLEHLVHLTMGNDKAGPYNDQKLQSYGLTDPHDLKRIEMFLVDPESFEPGGLAQPAGDFDQKREQLLDDMSSLREKLDLKKQKLIDEFPDEAAQNQASEAAVKKDPNLGVLHDLLGALGVGHDEPAAVEEGAEPTDEVQAEEADFPGEKEQAVRDKDTARYIAKLKCEGTANQSVLQALAHTLGEVGENADDKEAVDTDTEKAKSVFAEKIQSMEKTMDIFVKAMSRARELLDKDESDDEEQKPAASGGLVEPFDRAEELWIGTQTHAEVESQKLAADVERRGKQAAALEQENILLKSQIESLNSIKARPPVSRPLKSADGRKRSPKSTGLQRFLTRRWLKSMVSEQMKAKPHFSATCLCSAKMTMRAAARRWKTGIWIPIWLQTCYQRKTCRRISRGLLTQWMTRLHLHEAVCLIPF